MICLYWPIAQRARVGLFSQTLFPSISRLAFPATIVSSVPIAFKVRHRYQSDESARR